VGAGEAGVVAFLTTHTLFTDSGHVLDLIINMYSHRLALTWCSCSCWIESSAWV
jgi:hypothetical protein